MDDLRTKFGKHRLLLQCEGETRTIRQTERPEFR